MLRWSLRITLVIIVNLHIVQYIYYHALEVVQNTTHLKVKHQACSCLEPIKDLKKNWEQYDYGIINDRFVALICSAALFEELTTGWDAGVEILEILDQAFATVLPGYESLLAGLHFSKHYTAGQVHFYSEVRVEILN
ncbi:hypothetical protein RIF29_12120 [Crotalaria pallida]|uniref:Uncharacterized protein n=1 Tax=Crotalaria pallida TaxID=3830 RepID=A0AAN9P1G9_CROPI